MLTLPSHTHTHAHKGKRMTESILGGEWGRSGSGRDTRLTGLRDSLLFLPSIVSHPAGPWLSSAAAAAATIASAGSGHRGVTRGTAAVSLTGCDTLRSTINEYKRSG